MDSLLGDIYPVGSFYFCTQSTCPMASLISGSTWEKVGSSIITSVNTSVPIKGNGIAIGITDGDGNYLGMNGARGGSIQELGGRKGAYGKTLPYNEGGGVGETIAGNSYGLTTDANKSGIVGTVTRSALTVNIFKRTA